MKIGLTQKDKIVAFVKANPGKTATEIAIATGIRAANVSSVLIKDIDAQHGPPKLRRSLTDSGWQYFPA